MSTARITLVALTLILTFVSRARAKDRVIEIRMQDVRLEAVESEEVTRKVCKKVLTECRKAFAGIANRLALNSSRIFFVGERLPMWMTDAVRRDPTICVIVKPNCPPGEMGAEAYLGRLEQGRYVIYLPAPEGEIGPDDVHRIWREMTYAILAHTSWRACPLWLREGLAEWLAEVGTDGEHSLLSTFREELGKGVEELKVADLLTATNRKVWEQSGGAALSWAVVHLLDETNLKLVPSLFNQSRLLLRHLVFCNSARKALEEHSQIVFAQLTDSGVTEVKLGAALAEWIRIGFPEGSAYRKTDAHKSLRKLRLPQHYGTSITGRFASRFHVEDAYEQMRHYQPFAGGKVSWRLPWPSAMEAWVGVRGEVGVCYALRPSRSREVCILECPAWTAKRRGEQRIRPVTMELPRKLGKYGFIWVGVTSPLGLGYVFQQQYKLK